MVVLTFLAILVVVVGTYIFVAAQITRFSVRRTNSIAVGWTAALAFLLLPFADVLIGRLQWNYLCSSEGGHSVRQVVFADGFFDGDNNVGCESTCIEALGKRGFSFVEMRVSSPIYMTREQGLQRFYLTSAPSDYCADYDRYTRQYGKRLPDNQCIARMPISDPSSRYEVVIAQRSRIPYSPVRLERVTSHVRDRSTNELLALATSFSYWGGWIVNHSGLHVSGTSCPAEWNATHGAIEAAIKPSSKS